MTTASPYPKVTVYIVNHNYGRYLDKAIRSVLDQTFEDFELLIIDNGSTDGSREIIEHYIQHDRILTIFQENIGLNRTNNVALDRSTGRYVMRLDADDYLHANALEILSGVLDSRADVGLVFPDYFLVDQDGHPLRMIQRHDFDEVTLLDQPAHGACTMIRRECLEALEGYDESYHCQDGWDLWVRFIQRFGVTNVNLPLFYYRQHGQSLTRNEERILSTRSQILEKTARTRSDGVDSVAVIPIRGPMIDPTSMALRPLAGKPLLEWTIDEALIARRISRVIVTSSDPDIQAHVQRRYGDRVIFFHRDWRLAMLDMPLDETLTQVFNEMPEEWRVFDAVTLLFIESPFRRARYIDAAVDAMDVFGSNHVIGVRHLAGTLLRHQGDGMLPISNTGIIHSESRELFKPAGDLFVVRRGQFFRDFSDDRHIGHVEVDEAASLRIISDWTWRMAELYANEIEEMTERQKVAGE